mmetsp:Transcript_55072/g.112570  ORF Transcript_55072/g.112570 Transcript_55072/m.112570 type:complete len:249 (-) Transcript_55072:429-1175(-)
MSTATRSSMAMDRSSALGVRNTGFRSNRRGTHVPELVRAARSRARSRDTRRVETAQAPPKHVVSDEAPAQSGHSFPQNPEPDSEPSTPESCSPTNSCEDPDQPQSPSNAKAPTPQRMLSAIIRVYENRFVRVSVLRNENSTPVLPLMSSANTTRALALSAVLASVAAFVPPSSIPFRPGSAGRSFASRGPSVWRGSMLHFCQQRLHSSFSKDMPISPGVPRMLGRKQWTIAAVAAEWGFYDAVTSFTR